MQHTFCCPAATAASPRGQTSKLLQPLLLLLQAHCPQQLQRLMRRPRCCQHLDRHVVPSQQGQTRLPRLLSAVMVMKPVLPHLSRRHHQQRRHQSSHKTAILHHHPPAPSELRWLQSQTRLPWRHSPQGQATQRPAGGCFRHCIAHTLSYSKDPPCWNQPPGATGSPADITPLCGGDTRPQPASYLHRQLVAPLFGAVQQCSSCCYDCVSQPQHAGKH